MDFYINIEDEKKRLLGKVNTRDFSFDEDDMLLIDEFPEIKKEFFNLLSFGREIWTPEATEFFLRKIQLEDLEYIDDNSFFYCCLSLIDKGDLSEIDEIVNYTERKEEVFDYLVEKVKDPNYKIEKNFGNFSASAIIKAKRYDLFSQLQRGFYGAPTLDRESLKDVLKNYPYSFKELCLTMDEGILDEVRKDYQNLNIYELFEQFSNNPEQIFPILKAKLFSTNADLRFPLNDNIPIEEFYNLLTEDEKSVFQKRAILLNLFWYFEHTSKAQVIQDLPLIAQAMKKRSINSARFREYSDILLSDRGVMDALLEKKDFDSMITSPLLEEYIPTIIDLIKTKKIRTIYPISDDNLFQLCSKYPHFFRVCLQSDIISANSFSMLLKSDFLAKIIYEEIYKNKAVMELPSLSVETLKDLIRCGNIDIILRNVSKTNITHPEETSILLTEEECNCLINSIKDNLSVQDRMLRVASSLIFSNPTVLEFYLHSNSLMLEKTLDYINHHEGLSHFYTENLYQEVKAYFVSKYGLDLGHLDKLESTFGPTIMRYIDNENIIKIISLDPGKLDRLIGLFPKTTYDMNSVETMYDSLKQYAFSKENPDIVNIFVRIKHSLEDNNSGFIKDLEELVSVIDDKFYKYFAKKDPNLASACKNSPVEFLKSLVDQIKGENPLERENALRTLHKITDYYIAYKREEYRKNYQMKEELSLPYELDSKDVDKKILFPIYKHYSIIYYNLETEHAESLIEKVAERLAQKGINESLTYNTIEYYLYRRFSPDVDLNEIKKNLRYVVPVMIEVMKEYIPQEDLNSFIKALEEEELKKNYYVPKTKLDIYQLLTSLRLDCLEANILEENPTNNRIYQSLQATMKKYKLHVMPSCFKSLLESESIQISSDLTNISSFISYYHQVYETERKRLESQGKDSSNIMLSAANILLNASVLSSVSSVYSQILGSEDAKLIKANPSPNVAIYKTSGDIRLKEAVNWTLKSFKRMEISIPAFSHLVELANHRTMRVIVGNFTHPSNITHGERTGACMRIGGVGESLFNFCLEDANGFHIRFEDAQTGEYISRVSGFRNGNTVFLNELRNSCNKSLYSDDDVMDACKRISEMLIERSKESTCPIENVVVARAYATKDIEEVNLGISDNKKGLPRFYSDIQNSGIVLASTTSPFAPINMDKTSVPMYLPARDKTYLGEDTQQLLEKMNRIHSIKLALSEEDYEYIQPLSFEKEIVYGMANQDWYICMDSMGNIYEEIIPIDKRANEELEAARKIVEQYIPKKVEEDSYQM